MNSIYLVGFMGVGKSTAGKKLAAKLGWDFIDTDAFFEKKYKLSINAFFNKYGEELFRKLENDVLKSTFELNNCVIATGGGMPCYFDAINHINCNGLSIYLKMSDKAILARLTGSKQKRPLVMDLPEGELLQFVQKKITERNPVYSKARLTIPALSIDIDKLIMEIKSIINIK